jgi:hypothetical protein
LDDEKISRIDRDVLARVAATSRSTQRWLRTALQTIRTMPPAREAGADFVPPLTRLPRRRPRPDPELEREPEVELFPPDLDDMMTGRRDLKEQLEARPELAEELEGLSDIIDLLREAGKKRRQMGEDALREELLRQTEEDEEPDEDV